MISYPCDLPPTGRLGSNFQNYHSRILISYKVTGKCLTNTDSPCDVKLKAAPRHSLSSVKLGGKTTLSRYTFTCTTNPAQSILCCSKKDLSTDWDQGEKTFPSRNFYGKAAPWQTCRLQGELVKFLLQDHQVTVMSGILRSTKLKGCCDPGSRKCYLVTERFGCRQLANRAGIRLWKMAPAELFLTHSLIPHLLRSFGLQTDS